MPSPYTIPPYALYYDDEAEIRDAYWNVREGDRVIDVGARYGSYSLPALAAGGHVTAIDSNAEVLGLLRAAADLNGFDVTTVAAFLYDGTPYPEQLSAEIAEPCPPPDVGWSTLDDIAADDRVDWVKIDVEGAELGVLRGGLRTLEQRPNLVIEDHTRVYRWVRDNRIAERIDDLLRGFGYDIESVPYAASTGAPRDFTIATCES